MMSSYERDLETVRQRIVAFATAKVGKDVAQDIAQDTLLVLMQKYPEVKDTVDMLKLAVGIARNKFFERFRQVKKETALSESSPDASDLHRELERRQITNRILPAIHALGSPCRAVLHMKLIEGKPAVAIQTTMQIKSINTVYTWERRCVKQLIDLINAGTLDGLSAK